MSKIEVDPKLFVTCRLCLDEMGLYQIVPQVQMQIKYCFDIEVEPFDGLPQLICKKCESILSQYAGIKQIFQEKQNSLKLKIKNNDKGVVPNRQQQQNAVSSTQLVDSDNNSNNSLINKNQNLDTTKSLPSSRTSSIDRESCKDNDSQFCTKNKVNENFTSHWKRDYVKYFVCRYCSKSWMDKRSINTHLNKCHLIRKYSKVLRKCVIIKMNKIGSTTNLTKSNENVVYSRDKILNCKDKNYYIIFKPKLSQKHVYSYSSDEDFTVTKKKYKRLRLLSKSSNDTLVIEENNVSKNFLHADLEEEKHNEKQSKLTDVSDIEYVNIDDSDTDSTSITSSLKTTLINTEVTEQETYVKPTDINDKVIHNIISMCFNKYMKRLDTVGRNPKDSGNIDAFLQRKILSIGRKIVFNTGLNSTGIIRYMEHKDLDVVWIPKNQANVIIKTTLREEKCNNGNHCNWKNLKIADKLYEAKDFIDIFEQTAPQNSSSPKRNEVSNIENKCVETGNISKVNVNAELDSNTIPDSHKIIYLDNNAKLSDQTVLKKNLPSQCDSYDRKVDNSVLYLNTPETEKQNILSKLLNANPVPNPRQLPKKSFANELHSLLTNSNCGPNMKTVPNQMSNFDNNFNNKNEELTMPIITSTMSLAEPEVTKSQLPRIKVKPVSELMPDKTLNQPETAVQSANAWPTNYYNESQNVFIQNENTPVVFMTNGVPCCSNVKSQQLDTVSHSQYNMNQSSKILVLPNSNVPSQTPVAQKPSNREQYVSMHTVEFPNKKTNSPFRYFQELLQIHNMVLLDSTDIVTSPMSCLIKFKLVFQQESTSEVTLCLSLFYNRNTFCIRVKDIESKFLAIAKLPAYWQWEILKEFKGNIVPKLYENASKIGQDVLNKTTYFVSLLGSIVFSKNV